MYLKQPINEAAPLHRKYMLTSRERVFIRLYSVGYALYVGISCALGWPQLSFSGRLLFTVYQVFVYGPFWPVLLVLGALGLDAT